MQSNPAKEAGASEIAPANTTHRTERTCRIVGIDEARQQEPHQLKLSLARALLKARPDVAVRRQLPEGVEELVVVEVVYRHIEL